MAGATHPRHRIIRHAFAALALVLSIAPSVGAQSITDPRRLEFLPSPDHDTVDSTTGVPLVSNYTLDVFIAGGTVAVYKSNLGKPAPESDGIIRITFASLLLTPLSAGVTYEAVVSAVGPAGTTSSARSNTFSLTPVATPCSFTLSPASQTFAATGGSSTVNVTTTAGCNWTATTSSSWITLANGASRTSSGSVGITAASNPTTQARTATLTIAGKSFVVTEQPGTCTYTVSPLTITVSQARRTGTISVTTSSACSWTSSSSTSWISLTGSRSGSGSVSYTVAANSGTTTRTATVTIAGVSVRFSQGALSGPTAPANLRILK